MIKAKIVPKMYKHLTLISLYQNIIWVGGKKKIVLLNLTTAQSAEAVEYAGCISVEGVNFLK